MGLISRTEDSAELKARYIVIASLRLLFLSSFVALLALVIGAMYMLSSSLLVMTYFSTCLPGWPFTKAGLLDHITLVLLDGPFTEAGLLDHIALHQ